MIEYIKFVVNELLWRMKDKAENEASRRTIRANGGEYIETVYLEADNVNLERYRIQL